MEQSFTIVVEHTALLMGGNANDANIILLTKTTAAQTEDALSYYRVRGLHFLAVVFVVTIVCYCTLFSVSLSLATFG